MRGAGESGMARLVIETNMVQGKRTPEIDTAWGKIETQLQALQALAKDQGFSCAIVALPPRELVTGQYPGTAYVSQLHAVADPVGFPVIDPVPAMMAKRSDKDGLYIAYDRNHPDALGHLAIAEAIVAQIQDRILRVSNPPVVSGFSRTSPGPPEGGHYRTTER